MTQIHAGITLAQYKLQHTNYYQVQHENMIFSFYNIFFFFQNVAFFGVPINYPKLSSPEISLEETLILNHTGVIHGVQELTSVLDWFSQHQL